MSAATAGAKQRWVWAAGGAVLVGGALVALFSLWGARPVKPPSTKPRPKLVIELAERREKSALDEEARLLDPTALFQPSRWSTAQLQVARPEASGSFQGYRIPPKFGFADSDLRLGRLETFSSDGSTSVSQKLRASLDLPDPVTMPSSITELLAGGSLGPVALGFGRTEEAVEPLPSRGALIEIVAMGTGRPALPQRAMAQIQALMAAAKPPVGREWQAMEFSAAVAPAGLSSPLTITVHSGVDEVDVYFQNFLVKTARIGERLTPGFYRISVGP